MKKKHTFFVMGSLAYALMIVIFLGDEVEKNAPWGPPVRDVALSIRPQKSSYTVNETIEILVLIKNFGDDRIQLWEIRQALHNFKMVLFFADGQPVAKSSKIQEYEVIGDPMKLPVYSMWTVDLAPGQIREEVLSLRDWFEIEQPGTYYLIVMRRFQRWDDGILISNMVKITIGEPEKK